jgi:hypothetical protein
MPKHVKWFATNIAINAAFHHTTSQSFHNHTMAGVKQTAPTRKSTAGHNVAPPNSASFCHHEFRRLFEWARERWGTMREEFASNSFLAVAVAGLVLLFSGLIALAMI